MKNKMAIGLDQWRLPDRLVSVVRIATSNHLEFYDMKDIDDVSICYAPVYQRHQIARLFPKGHIISTTGMLGYFIRSIKKPTRMIGVLCAILLWCALSRMIYAIDIKGSDEESRKLIEKTLVELKVTPPFYDKDIVKVKADLKKKLEHKIAWLEIEKLGSRYRISYTPKEFATIDQLGHAELVAQSDGVIERFDVAHGNKMRKVNEYVHKGDVLVSNVILTSDNKNAEVYVAGRVFAYTWKDVSIEMKNDGMPKSMQYFDLLLEARSNISKQMKKDDRIYDENILQFSKELGKIKMVVHYTLIQDITTP